MGTAETDAPRSAVGGIETSPKRAANPRPSRGGVFLLAIRPNVLRDHYLLFLQNFRAQSGIGLRAGRFRIIHQNRNPVARRLRNADIARNRSVEDPVTEMVARILFNQAGQAVAPV